MKYNSNQKRVLLTGILGSISDSLTTFFLTAFALIFGATNAQIGIIAAIPYIAVIMMELPGAKLMDYFSRKSITFFSTFLSRIAWASIIIIPYIFKQSPVSIIILFYFIIKFLDMISDPPWISLLADIVPEKIRGRFFGFRNVLINTFSALAALIGGFYLDLYPKENLIGFLSLFTTGIIFGIGTSFVVKGIKEPKCLDKHHHSFKEFLSLKKELRQLSYSIICFNFATMIASPFFTVYMLKNLGMSYKFFVIATAIAAITKIISQSHIGKISDKYGDKPVAIISTMATSFVPLIYFFITPENIWLVIPAQIISGLAWAGVDISVFNLMLDKSDIERRSIDIAGYNTLTSIPMILGPIVGGYIADNVKIIYEGISLVFLTAFILRLLSSITLFRIKESRVKKEYSINFVLRHMIALHPLKEIEHTFRIFRRHK